MITMTVEFKLPAGDMGSLLTRPMQRFLTEGMTLTHGYLASPGVVPIDTGRLRSSLQPGSGTTGIDTASPPLWFKVGTTVDYATALDQPEEREPHYRAGPSAGRPTAGWLSNSPEHVRGAIEGLLPSLAADIAASWDGR